MPVFSISDASFKSERQPNGKKSNIFYQSVMSEIGKYT